MYGLASVPETVDKALLTMAEVDHFVGLDTNRWNITKDAAASIAHTPGNGGKVAITTSAVDNEEAYLHTNEIFLPAAGGVIEAVVKLDFAEAATNAANLMIGFMDGVAADALQDDGAGPKASFDGAVLYKVDGGTRYHALASKGTTKVTKETSQVAGQSSSQFVKVRLDVNTLAESFATFYVGTDGTNMQQLAEYNASPRVPLIRHQIDLTGLTEMAFVIGLKNGSATSETVTVDLVSLIARL